MCYILALVESSKCCVVLVVLMTLHVMLQRKLQDEKCVVFNQLVFYMVNPEAIINTI